MSRGGSPQCHPIHPHRFPGMWLQENEQMVEGGAIGMCHLLFYRGLTVLATEGSLRTR